MIYLAGFLSSSQIHVHECCDRHTNADPRKDIKLKFASKHTFFFKLCLCTSFSLIFLQNLTQMIYIWAKQISKLRWHKKIFCIYKKNSSILSQKRLSDIFIKPRKIFRNENISQFHWTISCSCTLRLSFHMQQPVLCAFGDGRELTWATKRGKLKLEINWVYYISVYQYWKVIRKKKTFITADAPKTNCEFMNSLIKMHLNIHQIDIPPSSLYFFFFFTHLSLSPPVFQINTFSTLTHATLNLTLHLRIIISPQRICWIFQIASIDGIGSALSYTIKQTLSRHRLRHPCMQTLLFNSLTCIEMAPEKFNDSTNDNWNIIYNISYFL